MVDLYTGKKNIILMHIWLFALYIILIFIPLPAKARPVIADLAIREIDIDSKFTGTDILLFGARNDPGDIVVVVRGPETSYKIRKKERIAGIWANKKQISFGNVDSFYSIASNRPLEQINNDLLLNNLHIGVNNIQLNHLSKNKVASEEFKKAFINYQEKKHFYFPDINKISFIGDTLFRTVIRFPENILRGVYTAEIYLFSDGQLSGIQSTPIIVSKKGFDAFVYDAAYKYPFLYGIVAVSIAL